MTDEKKPAPRESRGPVYCYAKVVGGKVVPLKKGDAPILAGTWVRPSAK
jgi:hypothetical protein